MSMSHIPTRDWTEDFPHENGQYWCRCANCGNQFVGHKRRVICKLCATRPNASPSPQDSADKEPR